MLARTKVRSSDRALQRRTPRTGEVLEELRALVGRFGTAAARDKLRLLKEIELLDRIGPRSLIALQQMLDFLRAYPDDRRVLDATLRVRRRLREWVKLVPGGGENATLRDQGFPGARNVYPYAFGVLQRLVRHHPDCVEILWDELEDDGSFSAAFELLLSGVENEASEDTAVGWAEWMAQARPSNCRSDLEFVLRLVDRAPLRVEDRAHLLDGCGLPICHELKPGLGRCEIELPHSRICYQKSELTRERFPLEPRIRAPMAPPRPVAANRGEALIERCVAALCARSYEIHPLIWANPRDVFLIEGQRGIQIVLVGTVPAQRGALAALYFFLVTKNGVPIAYGPASPLFGSCEMGINLFPEFRGGEIRAVYAEVMRALHHVLAVDSFFLTRYAMGEDNEDALRTGAFWCYRKLGFVPTNPEVEELAREEERKVAARRGYRCDRRTLRRLSQTEAIFNLTGSSARRFPFGRIGMAVSRFLAAQPGGPRELAEERCSKRVRRSLEMGRARDWTQDEHRALARLAPLLAMIPDLHRWSARDRAALVRVIRTKGAASEARATRLMTAHVRLREALFDLLD